MPQKIKLQSAVSRPYSLRMQLSNHEWKKGFQPFFLYKVPFSGRSNLSAAQRHAQLIERYFANFPPSVPIQLVEFGAGHGMLSKHVLDILSGRYPELYARVCLFLSDYSPDLHVFSQTSRFFQKHAQKIMHLDPEIMVQRVDRTIPTYAYATYFYSAMPCRHFCIGSEYDTEYYVETWISKDIVFEILADTELTSVTDLVDLYATKPDVFLEKYGAKIHPYLEERYVASDHREKTPLADSFRTQNLGAFVNYSPAILKHLQQIQEFQHITYVMSDAIQMGQAQDTLMRQYGPIGYFPITCAYIAAHTTDFSLYKRDQGVQPPKVSSPRSVRPLGNSRLSFSGCCDAVVMDGIFEQMPALASDFSALYATDGTEEVQHFLAVYKQCHDHPSITACLENTLSLLSSTDQQDYFLLKEICLHLFTQQQISVLESYLHLFVETYQEFAVDAYRIYLFLAMQAFESWHTVQSYANSILMICPDDAYTLGLLGFYAIRRDMYEEAYRYLSKAWEKSPDRIRPCQTDPSDFIVQIKQSLEGLSFGSWRPL